MICGRSQLSTDYVREYKGQAYITGWGRGRRRRSVNLKERRKERRGYERRRKGNFYQHLCEGGGATMVEVKCEAPYIMELYVDAGFKLL